MVDEYMEKMIKHLKEKLEKRREEIFMDIVEQGFADDIFQKSLENIFNPYKGIKSEIPEGFGLNNLLETATISGRACEVILNEGLE